MSPLWLVALSVVMLGSVPLIGLAQENPCNGARGELVNASRELKAEAAKYKQALEQSVTPEIQEELSGKEGKASIAAVVRRVLNRRAQRLSEIRARIDTLMSMERIAFSDWQRCATKAGGRLEKLSGESRNVVQAHQKLAAELSDLLLDEAYRQYKDYRDPSPPSGPYYGSAYDSQAPYSRQRSPYPGPYGDRYGYGPPGYDPRRSPYQGYYR